jgi:1-acyl-sn-glycerol-3-phosphate acyltransferase
MSHIGNGVRMEPLYGLSHALLRIAFEIAFRGDVVGLENLPEAGGYIVACNHASVIDPVLAGLYIPQQVAFFARRTLWKPGLPSWWLDGVGTIPVDRDGGRDVSAIKRVLRALGDGKVVILFPEGTRSRDGGLQPAKPGVGFFACRSRARVIPARIFGSFEALGRSGRLRMGTPVSVHYGAPLEPDDYDDPATGQERYEHAAEKIMSAIAQLEPLKPAAL